MVISVARDDSINIILTSYLYLNFKASGDDLLKVFLLGLPDVSFGLELPLSQDFVPLS